MTAKYFKKGFISIFWVAIIMVVTTAVMVTATYVFTNYAATPRSLMWEAFLCRYITEVGIEFGCVKLSQNPLDANISNLAQGGSCTYAAAVPPIITVIIKITRLHPDGSTPHYTITATWDSKPTETMTADWYNGVITQIN